MIEENVEQNKDNSPFKIILMGKHGAGKTSIKSVIFDNNSPNDTLKYASTNEIKITYYTFLDKISMVVYDTCSDDSTIKTYFTNQKQFIFSNVGMMIYIFDICNKKKDNILYFEK